MICNCLYMGKAIFALTTLPSDSFDLTWDSMARWVVELQRLPDLFWFMTFHWHGLQAGNFRNVSGVQSHPMHRLPRDGMS